ncbi:MAG: transposase, partial [Negativicutes bacterium]
ICGYDLYAYCFLGNHIHLLIKEGKESLGQIFKRIGSRYVYYFNQKYKRIGHLFQDRFKSEPVNDDSYLLTVLTYIHNNPVKAGLSKTAAEYQWSSYNEYTQSNNLVNVQFVLGMITRQQFIDLHNDERNADVLDIAEDNFRVTDAEAVLMIKEICGLDSSELVMTDIGKRNLYIRQLREKGLSIRQIARVTGIRKGIIEKLK